MKNLLWAIPLFPLAGFVINGLLYLLSHRTQGEAHGEGHGADHAAAPSAAAAHDAHGGGHGEAHAIPFKTIHTVVGAGSVAIACVLAFGARRQARAAPSRQRASTALRAN